MNDNIEIGQNVIIEKDVKLGTNVNIGHNVIIYSGTIIDDNVTIQDNAVIGKQPTKAKSSILPDSNKLSPARIESGVTIGTSSIIYVDCKIGKNVFVADLATIRERVTIGDYTIIGRGVAVENDCSVGERCKLETNCYITAYSNIGSHVFIAPCVVSTNDNFMGRSQERFDNFKGVTIKDGGRIGANSTVLPGKVIKEDGTVGAASVVTKDVQSEDLVIGSPAKVLRKVPGNQLLRNQER